MSALSGNHYIGGAWISDAPNGQYDSINPANGTKIATSPKGSAGLAEQAIAVARQAFEGSPWASSPRLRADVLLEFAAQLDAQKEQIAQLLTQENGKVLSQSEHEVAAGISEARYYAGLARNVFGRTFESGPGKFSFLTREAAGVVSVIVPWNAPVTLLVRSVAPALAAGCCIVVKPAPQTPLTNAAVIACFDRVANLPPGVVNSVNEAGIEVGTVLSTHPDVDVLSFTGSSATGKKMMANASATTKRLSLELGGKAPAVVFDDADLAKATSEIIRGSLALNGQMCTAVSRILVHDAVFEQLLADIVAGYRAVRIGDPSDRRTGLGPVVDRANQSRLLDLIARAGDGLQLPLRGTAPSGALECGAFVTPSVIRVDDVRHWSVQDELFGPIVTFERFTTEAEALARANATRFGLAASVFTRDLDRAMRVSRKLKFGTVWINSHNRLMAEAETGGLRESGLGRLHGPEAMNEFLETKHIYLEAGN